MVETSQLQTMLAVAQAKSFSKAAEDLHVTQSAISQSIKNLENKLGTKLFKRSGKRIVLTVEGEKLCRVADEFMSKVEETIEDIKYDKTSMAGKTRIGTLNGLGKSWVAGEILDLAKKYPDLRLKVHLGFQEDLVRDFQNLKLDLLILPEENLPKIGVQELLCDEKSTLVFPDLPEFNLTDKTTLAELSNYPTILYQDEDHLFLKWCKDHFGKTPKKINKKFTINSHGSMLQAIDEGLGIAVLPDHVFKRSYFRNKLKTLGDKFEVSNGKLFLVYHKEAKDNIRVNTVVNALKSSSYIQEQDML